MSYAVAAFDLDNSVAVVPTNWFKSDTACFWPPYLDEEQLQNAQRIREDPASNWKVYIMRVFGTYGQFLL